MSAAAYDPGKATAVRPLGENRFAVDSYRGKETSYTVTLGQTPHCTCPHFRARLATTPGAECKHIHDCKRQSQWLAYADRARTLSDENLARLLVKYTEDGNAELAGALRMERERRRPTKASEPKVWKSEKLFGPTTDAEMYEALR